MARRLSAGAPHSPARRPAWRRRVALATLVTAVVLMHALVVSVLENAMIGPGAAASRRPPPISVSFVRELAPQAPAPVAPAPPPPRRAAAPKKVAQAAEPAASAPEPPASAVEEAVADAAADAGAESVAPAASEALAMEEAASQALAASAPAAASDVAQAAQAPASAPRTFDWPPSTRLSYTMTGWYQGEVQGSARVLWLRERDHYQVHLEVVIGPSFSPLASRRMVSDGELTADGLRPRRYDEETTVALRGPRTSTLRFEDDQVVLANGKAVAAPPGLQDAASQFVQLTWLFTLQPQRLQPGQAIEFPLALPRRVERWRYEVIGEGSVDSPVGTIAAVHVRPSRETESKSGRNRDLVAEAWFAPTLQYLPVRIRIRQGTESFVELNLARLPEQAQ